MNYCRARAALLPAFRILIFFFTSSLTMVLLGCGGGSSSMANTTSPLAPTSGSMQFGHVVLVVEENHSYSEVIGSSSMPYLNSLANQYGLATQYYANTHPSIGNYFELTAGQTVTTDDGIAGPVDVDNIVRILGTAGKTWKSYAEGLPSVGYIAGDAYPYVRHHNILTYFTDVTQSTTQTQNIVPFSQFASDVSKNALPNFSFVVPNLLNDAHDGPLSVADTWLRTNMKGLISSSTFQADGLLIIVFDESEGTDTEHGGGHVATVIVSPKAKKGFQSTTFYQHQSALRLTLEGLGITSYPADAAQAPNMGEFF
jgi:acid phosphatase